MSARNLSETLGESFRQSRRELVFMLAAWVVFFTWITVSSNLTAWERPAPGDDPAMLFGLPRWVALSVVVPWLAANVVIVYFALFFMKDTDLEAGADSNGRESENGCD